MSPDHLVIFPVGVPHRLFPKIHLLHHALGEVSERHLPIDDDELIDQIKHGVDVANARADEGRAMVHITTVPADHEFVRVLARDDDLPLIWWSIGTADDMALLAPDILESAAG